MNTHTVEVLVGNASEDALRTAGQDAERRAGETVKGKGRSLGKLKGRTVVALASIRAADGEWQGWRIHDNPDASDAEQYSVVWEWETTTPANG